MANLKDYISWRGDLSFSASPFNEVDNLVLAELTYGDFDNVLDESGRRMTIPELRDAYFAMHPREEVSARKSFTGSVGLLLDPMAESVRFSGIEVCWYHNHISVDADVQMAALTYFLPDGKVYVSFRGSDGTIVGWKEDFNFSYMIGTAGQKEAVEYLNHLNDTKNPIIVGGHSKGGNFAVYASAFCAPWLQARITDVYNNDGPGFPKSVLSAPEYMSVRDRIHSIIPENSMIGILMHSDVSHKVIASSEKGIAQHDAMSWQVLGNHFVEVDGRNLDSFIFDETMQLWLKDLSDEERKSFIETVFGIFEDTGLETMDEINDAWYKTFPEIIHSLGNLEKDKRDEVINILMQLGEKYGKVVKTQLKKKVTARRQKIAERKEAGEDEKDNS